VGGKRLAGRGEVSEVSIISVVKDVIGKYRGQRPATKNRREEAGNGRTSAGEYREGSFQRCSRAEKRTLLERRSRKGKKN